MITIDCPLCAGPLTTDDALAAVTCEECGVTAEVAPDPAPRAVLEPAA